MAKKKYNEIDINYVIDEYSNKLRHSTDLANELGVSDWWIRDRLKANNIPVRKQGGGLNVICLLDRQFGNYTVVERLPTHDNRQGARWKVRCSCGNESEVNGGSLKNGQVSSCGYCGKRPNKWVGVGELSGTFFGKIRNCANHRNIYFDVSKEYLWELFLKQNRKCKLSGVDLTFDDENSVNKTASLDRIDSSQGYIVGNVQWVHKNVNAMKMSLCQDEFIEICKKIAKNFE